jgi:hypothetical protein
MNPQFLRTLRDGLVEPQKHKDILVEVLDQLAQVEDFVLAQDRWLASMNQKVFDLIATMEVHGTIPMHEHMERGHD